MREHGRKLPPDVIKKRGPTAGQLTLYPRLQHPNERIVLAGLFRPGDQHMTWLIPPLDRAQVTRIAPGGMIITGQECHQRGSKSPTTRYRQSWYCKYAT